MRTVFVTSLLCLLSLSLDTKFNKQHFKMALPGLCFLFSLSHHSRNNISAPFSSTFSLLKPLHSSHCQKCLLKTNFKPNCFWRYSITAVSLHPPTFILSKKPRNQLFKEKHGSKHAHNVLEAGRSAWELCSSAHVLLPRCLPGYCPCGPPEGTCPNHPGHKPKAFS